ATSTNQQQKCPTFCGGGGRGDKHAEKVLMINAAFSGGRPQGGLNPRYRRERAMSLASRRGGPWRPPGEGSRGSGPKKEPADGGRPGRECCGAARRSCCALCCEE